MKKYLQAFSHFSTISVHLKWKRTRLLSPKREYTSCHTRCWMTSDLGTYNIMQFHRNSKNAWNWWESTPPATQKTNFDSCATKLGKAGCKMFHRKTYVAYLRGFVCNILSKVVWEIIFSCLTWPRPHWIYICNIFQRTYWLFKFLFNVVEFPRRPKFDIFDIFDNVLHFCV